MFSYKIHKCINTGWLAKILASGMVSHLLRGSEIHLESCCLPPRYMCQYCTLRVIMPCRSLLLFIGVIVG